MSDNKSDNRDQSEFNMAVSWLNRLNALFYTSDQAAIELDSHAWFHTLLALFRELSTEMKDAEITKKQKEIEDINKAISKQIKDYERTGKKEINSDLYMKLHNFELFIRGILKDSGLQNKIKDNAMDALN